MNVLRRDRAQPQRHRPLDAVVLERRPPDRPRAAGRLVEPRPLHWRRRIAPTAPPLVPVGEVRLEGLRIVRGRHPINPRRRLVAGPALGVPEPVDVPQGRQRRAHQRWRLPRLLRYPLEWGGDGWWPRRVSPLASQQHVLPGVACPAVGPLGLSSPPSRPAGLPRRPAVLCAATTATTPSRRPAVVPRSPIPGGDPLLHSQPGPRTTPPRWARRCSPPAPRSGTFPRSLGALPSSRGTPLHTCPALRPRWCPHHSPVRGQDCCLPRHGTRRLCPRVDLRGYPPDHD
jgi:hypothetical protein